MKISVTTEVLAEKGLSIKDFGVLLYYLDGGRRDIEPYISTKLWNNGYLVKELYGYSFEPHAFTEIESWTAKSDSPKNENERYSILADKLRELFPPGKKEGTCYMWRDSTVAIANKLRILSTKFGVTFTDEEAINATKKYIESFNGNYSYMQLLKYFILKRDAEKQEETSQLLSYIQNNGNDSIQNFDRGELV